MKNSSPKVHAYLAQCGLGSRRQIERWIIEKRVLVNGELCEVGQRVSPSDHIKVDGQLVNLSNDVVTSPSLLLYHKRPGEICTRARGELPTVFDSLPPVDGRWISVGRLDVNSSGLLLFTNNGQLANTLMHPSTELERVYHVRVWGKLDTETLRRLSKGINIDGDFLHFTRIQPMKALRSDGTNQWFVVTLNQGKNREIRRLFESQNCRVSRLIRVQYGSVMLPDDLKPGAHRLIRNWQPSELGIKTPCIS